MKHTLQIGVLCLLVLCMTYSILGCSPRTPASQPQAGPAAIEPKPTAAPQPTREVIIDEIPEIVYTSIPDNGQGVGAVRVYTLPLSDEYNPTLATFLASGKVMICCGSGNNRRVYVMNDDATNKVLVYRGAIPGDARLLPFADNTRVLVGDAVLECPDGKTFDDCEPMTAVCIPIEYPAAFVNVDVLPPQKMGDSCFIDHCFF